jgi:hypothetical protein
MNNRKFTPKTKRDTIDYSKLSGKERLDLSELWEKEARIFETRFERYLHTSDSSKDEEKTSKLNYVANMLWKRIRTLERFRLKHDNTDKKLG